MPGSKWALLRKAVLSKTHDVKRPSSVDATGVVDDDDERDTPGASIHRHDGYRMFPTASGSAPALLVELAKELEKTKLDLHRTSLALGLHRGAA